MNRAEAERQAVQRGNGRRQRPVAQRHRPGRRAGRRPTGGHRQDRCRLSPTCWPASRTSPNVDPPHHPRAVSAATASHPVPKPPRHGRTHSAPARARLTGSGRAVQPPRRNGRRPIGFANHLLCNRSPPATARGSGTVGLPAGTGTAPTRTDHHHGLHSRNTQQRLSVAPRPLHLRPRRRCTRRARQPVLHRRRIHRR